MINVQLMREFAVIDSIVDSFGKSDIGELTDILDQDTIGKLYEIAEVLAKHAEGMPEEDQITVLSDMLRQAASNVIAIYDAEVAQ